MSDKKLATVAVRTGIESDTQHNAVVPPIYLTSTYSFPQLGELPQYDYSRSGNPTRNMLADALSELEGGGAGGVVTSCGTAAINLLASALLGPGDLVIAPPMIAMAGPIVCSTPGQEKAILRLNLLISPIRLYWQLRWRKNLSWYG